MMTAVLAAIVLAGTEPRHQEQTLDLGAGTASGYAVFDVTAFSREAVLTIEYANHPKGLTGKGDFQRETSARYLGETFDLPVLPGNINRHEIYRICRTGRYVAPLIQGQERYARFHLEPADAAVTIANFAITNADVYASDPLVGSFRCSDERLNKLWDASVWTCRLASFPNHNAWKNAGGRLMPRKLEKDSGVGTSRTAAPCDGTLEVVYEFDANPHFPCGAFDILAGGRRTRVRQDSTNELKTVSVPVKKGETFGFAVEKESWPMIDSVTLRDASGRAVFADNFEGTLDAWAFTRTRAYVADGAKRDRLVWSGDLWWANHNLFHAFAPDAPYVRDSVKMLAENQTPEGYVQACPYPENHAPLKSGEVGPWTSDEFAAWLVPVAWDYLLYSGDTATAREVYPAVKKLMGYLAGMRADNGLFRTAPELLMSIEGVRSTQPTHRAYMNILYWMSCRDAARIAAELGETADAAAWRTDAAAVAGAIRARLWDAQGLYFRRSLEDANFSALINAFALATGFADAREAKELLPRLTRFGVGKIQALITRGKFEHGCGRSALASFENSNWFRIIEDDWEGAHCTTECMYLKTGSWWDESHPDTAMAGQLSDYVLGLRPTEPGWRAWVFEPRPGALTFAEGRVPTPRGVIEARWERVGDKLKCRVKEPGQAAREFERPVPEEPDLSASEAMRKGQLEIIDCFSDMAAVPDAYAELEFDLGKVTGIAQIKLIPTDNGVGWPSNLKIETAAEPGKWELLREFKELPRQETVVEAFTVVGYTNARYLRLSATRLGPAWLENNYNLQFNKVLVVFE